MVDTKQLRLVSALVALLLLAPVIAVQAQPQPRIVNGNHTQLFPTTGALLVSLGGQLSAICSGTLIGCNAFLTAAHCVCPGDTTCTPNPTPYAVFLQHGGIRAAIHITVHPSYLFGERNDVAIVTLASAFDGISPTAINTVGSPTNGTAAAIAGFGVTRGTTDDSGIKRAGSVLTASCQGFVPQAHHVCWHFEKPLGLAGDNSNTCSGDSGGPLFVDFGGGQVVAGITSGGFSNSCLPSDLSFDTDVFVNRAFIAANADLSNPTCGAISQVGDVDTEVTAGGSAALTRATQKCRKEIGKQISKYSRAKLRAMQRCFDSVGAGKLSSVCPDAGTATKILRAASRVDVFRIGKMCGPAIIAASQLGGACAGAENATDLRACILATGDNATDAMLDREYANNNPSAPLPAAEAQCQKQIANATNQYAAGRVRALTICRNSQDKGRVESCPDTRTQTKLTKLIAALEPNIERKCTNALVSALDAAAGFGGTCAGSTTTAGLAACELAEHDEQIDALLALAKAVPTSSRSTFEVAPGTDRFRVTTNGIDNGFNNVDLYVRFGSPPTTATFDAASTNGGVFEAVEVSSPSAGTWYVLANDSSGTKPDFQVTVTTFQP